MPSFRLSPAAPPGSPQSFEERIAAVRENCRRARRRDCDAQVEEAVRAAEEKRQRAASAEAQRRRAMQMSR